MLCSFGGVLLWAPVNRMNSAVGRGGCQGSRPQGCPWGLHACNRPLYKPSDTLGLAGTAVFLPLIPLCSINLSVWLSWKSPQMRTGRCSPCLCFPSSHHLGAVFCDLLHFSEDCSVFSLAVSLKGIPRWRWETHSLGGGNSGRYWWERRELGYVGLMLGVITMECTQAACYQMLNTCHLFIALIIICNHKTSILAVWSWAMDIIPLNFRGLTCNKGMMIILNELILYEPFRTGPGI